MRHVFTYTISAHLNAYEHGIDRPKDRSEATTRWQGTVGANGFFLSDDPTARKARGEPICSATLL